MEENVFRYPGRVSRVLFTRIISLLSSKIRLWSNEIAANGTKWRGTARDGMLGMITKETSMYRSIAKINQILYYSMIGDIFLVINGNYTLYNCFVHLSGRSTTMKLSSIEHRWGGSWTRDNFFLPPPDS